MYGIWRWKQLSVYFIITHFKQEFTFKKLGYIYTYIDIFGAKKLLLKQRNKTYEQKELTKFYIYF